MDEMTESQDTSPYVTEEEEAHRGVFICFGSKASGRMSTSTTSMLTPQKKCVQFWIVAIPYYEQKLESHFAVFTKRSSCFYFYMH